jgi:hypothetical protein
MNNLSLFDYKALRRLKRLGPGHLSEIRAASLMSQNLVRREGKNRYAISAEGISLLAEHTRNQKIEHW